MSEETPDGWIGWIPWHDEKRLLGSSVYLDKKMADSVVWSRRYDDPDGYVQSKWRIRKVKCTFAERDE